jgi:hypothetical protein
MTTSTTPTARLRSRGRSIALFLALVLGLSPSTTQAATGATTSMRTAAIVVRSLAYHRGLRDRAGARTDLVVLTTPERAADENTVFLRLQSIGVQGLPLVVSTATPGTADELRAVLDTRHIEAVYVDELDPALDKPLRAFARERAIVVFAGRRGALDSMAQVVVVDDGERARIVVSLPELRAARIDLAADLLKLAEVIR